MHRVRRSRWSSLSSSHRQISHLESRIPFTKAFDAGPLEPPLLENTVPEHFASIVRQHGDQLAVVSRHQQKRLTYRSLDEESNALAHGLEQRGVKKGDRVAVSLGNSIEFATLTYAVFKLGAILTPLNPAFTAPQVASALTHLNVSHLVISAETNLPRKPPSANLPTLQHLIPDLSSSTLSSQLVPSLRSVVLVDNVAPASTSAAPSGRAITPYANLLSSFHDTAPSPRKLDRDDIVNIQFTSGTTSQPKAACLSHKSILNNGYHIGARLGLTHHDIVCCPPPLFHCFGSILGYMATATHGSAIVFPSESFNALASLQAVKDEGCTTLYGVPTMFLAELELLSSHAGSFPRGAFRNLRTGIAAGSQVPATLMRRLQNDLGLKDLCICYGMTETSPVSVMTSAADTMKQRTETVGRVMPHITAKVVVPSPQEEGSERTADINERGELLVAGYSVMSGYWGDPAKSAEVLIPETYTHANFDGASVEEERVWMRTGDEAAMDADGYVRITGRLKDLIIRGGENVRPGEVEDTLLGCDGVGEVSCFGVRDERYGEAVAVAVIRKKNRGDGGKGTEDDIRKFVRDRLANHCVPRHVVFVDALPKTPSGKIQRFKLREEFERRWGLEVRQPKE